MPCPISTTTPEKNSCYPGMQQDFFCDHCRNKQSSFTNCTGVHPSPILMPEFRVKEHKQKTIAPTEELRQRKEINRLSVDFT